MTKSTPERVKILNEASELIVGQRQEDYGTPEENFQRMADFANIHFKKNLEQNIPFSAQQTAEYMILLKMSRLINSPTRDTYVDIAGYAGIAGELADLNQPTLPHEDLKIDGYIGNEKPLSTVNITINPASDMDPRTIRKMLQEYAYALGLDGGVA